MNSKSESERISQQTQNIFMAFIQSWTNVEDVGPTLYKCYTMVCVSWVSTKLYMTCTF